MPAKLKNKLSYSVTLDWEEESLYTFLSGLRDGLGCFRTPVHISMAAFLRLADDGLDQLQAFLAEVCRTHSAHNVVFGKMREQQLFGEKIVAVPLALAGEFGRVWNAFQKIGMGTKFAPHVTIATGVSSDADIHEYVRASLASWGAQHGVLNARAVGFKLWEHTAGNKNAKRRLTNAKEVAAEMGTQVSAFKKNADEVVNSVAGLRDLIGAENQEHAAGAKFKRATIDLDAVAADLEVAFGAVINELQEMFPEPKDAAGHENRSKAVEVALEKAGVVLIKVCGDHGLDEERVAAHWEPIRAYLLTAIVFLGDIVEQHPVLFESLFFVLVIAILPEVWLSRPLFRIFGFGPQGPIKGSAAAWAQRVFFGARVQENSWFAILQRAGMVGGSWFGSAWRWVLCTVFKVC
ncbi:hypothetical protein HMN09_01267600 [Mycena chlorophos]|uniref:Uncharacterized protein n=1 Tax=Mycena chlorophos TaxID=658473 RepID=A0A8H6S2Z0_MYCCL|nr:hypothetical protein HMN09_01267600 [Mycena chlorophos]